MAESADHTNRETPEWCHFIIADDVQDKEMNVKISPDAEEMKNLVRRLGVESLESLTAQVKLKRENKRVIKISGSFDAKLTQNCVVTLTPVKDHIKEDFEAWYADPDQAVSFARARHERDKAAQEEERPMLEEFEDPEPIIEGKINLGEVVAQYLILALNPYPRSKEAQKILEEKADLPVKENPFAALKALKEDR